jgi:alpha-mannosidase
VGTHRHSPKADDPYVYTYMYKVCIDIPKGAKSVVLPYDPHVVVFAATLANDEQGVKPAAPLFETSLSENHFTIPEVTDESGNLLLKARVV